MASAGPRIACLQLDGKHGDVPHNTAKVKRLTETLQPGSLDLLCLPEMALTGYVFRDYNEIHPLLEDPTDEEQAPSYLLAKELAVRLCCYVVIGFPCKWTPALDKYLSKQRESSPFDARPAGRSAHEVGIESKQVFNAALLVNETGDLVHVARKHFAYEDDKRWAVEGPGFESVTVPKLGKVCLAICMDLNPYDFEAPFEKYELARYCQREGVDTLIVTMAWLSKKLDANEAKIDDSLRGEADLNTINYWAMRLSPFLPDFASTETSPKPSSIRFIACNRTGTEASSRFAGSSCALLFAQDGPRLLGTMDRREALQIFLCEVSTC